MICLSGLIYLPPRLIMLIALVMIFGHDATDRVHNTGGTLGVIWDVLHVEGPLVFPHHTVVFLYPLIPWVGVMAAGYCFGEVIVKEQKQRNAWMYGIGIAAIFLFVLLRSVNGYGDPDPWHRQSTVWRTFLDFLSDRKYPPSLL